MPKPPDVRMDDLAPRRAPERPGSLAPHRGGEKLMPLDEAIGRFVPAGSSVALGTCLEQMIPFAATREIIRRGIGDLTLIGPVSDICFDQLIGAGLCRCVMAAWVGNVMMGSAYCFRRAVERGEPRALDVVEFSNFTLALALHAAAIGSPYIPTRSALGSDIVSRNPYLAPIADPWAEVALAVSALSPDMAIVHVQRRPHDAILWGSLGSVRRGSRGAPRDRDRRGDRVPRADPPRPQPRGGSGPRGGRRVRGAGSAPSPVQGFHRRDHGACADYHRVTKTRGRVRGMEHCVDRGRSDLDAYVRRRSETGASPR